MKRLPRRYDATMKILRELSQSKNERIRLQAALRMADILMGFDQQQERIAIATERARKAEAESVSNTHMSMPEVELETAEEAAARFLARQRVTQ